MKKSLSVLLFLGVIACKNNNPSATGTDDSKTEKVQTTTASSPTPPVSVRPEEQTTDTTKLKVAGDSSLNRLVITFYSIGEGSEFKLITEYEDSVGKFSEKIGKNFDYKRLSWGREGETDFCFPLPELSSAQQADFVSMTRSVLKKGKWVHIYENYPCPKRRIR